jgi:site-specific DNA-methyltransferase (adenine-specific)
LIAPNGVIALFGSQPFLSRVTMPAIEWLKFSIIWHKNKTTNHLHAANMPLRRHEEIMIFSPAGIGRADRCKVRMTYNPVGVTENGTRKATAKVLPYLGNRRFVDEDRDIEMRKGFPDSVWYFPKDTENYHSAQKPVALLEKLIGCFSDAGDVVLDNCMGSGSTGVAAHNLGRQFIGIERERKFYDISVKRFDDARLQDAA